MFNVQEIVVNEDVLFCPICGLEVKNDPHKRGAKKRYCSNKHKALHNHRIKITRLADSAIDKISNDFKKSTIESFLIKLKDRTILQIANDLGYEFNDKGWM